MKTGERVRRFVKNWLTALRVLGGVRSRLVRHRTAVINQRSKRDGRAKGMACYLDIVPVQGVIEIGGIWFSPDMQRTRAATETLFLMMSYAMDGLCYRRLQWRCNALNERSRSAARRLGFRFEGIFYNHMIVKGKNRDTAWYSIIDQDWPEIREIFREWLGEENFDQDDVASQSLSTLMQNRKV